MNLQRLQSRYAVPTGWVLYAVAMGGLFFALTFPYDQLHAKLLVQFSQRTGIELHAERWDFRWPVGIVWTRPSIVVPGLQRLDAEQMQLEFKLGSLLRGQPVLTGTGHLNGGRDGPHGQIKTELTLASWSSHGPAQLLGTIEQVDLSRLGLPMVKKGILRTRFEQRWAELSAAQRSWLEEGIWHVELTGLTLEQVPIGSRPIASLSLSSLNGRLRCQAGRCRIEELRGESPDGMLTGEGVLVPHEPLSTSHLSLTLSVIMTEALKERLNLTNLGVGTPGLPRRLILSGPLSNLQVSL